MTAGFFASAALGQTLTWDASGANPTAPTDGDGNWSAAAANWSDGVTSQGWVNGDVAAIGSSGMAGTIVINDASGTVVASGINFNPVASGSYTIASTGGASLTLSGGAAINVASGVIAAISAPIGGSAGLTQSGPGTLVLSGNNTFTGAVAINGGAINVAAGGNLGAAGNSVSLGADNAGTTTSINDAVGALTLASGLNATIGSFRSATNNSTATNTLTINTGATLNVTGNAPLTGLNSTVNGVFVVGSPNLNAPITTKLTLTGGGALNVSGGSNNSSFLVGVGNCNSSANVMAPTLDMSGLSNFTYTTGTGAIPAAGGNEFAIGHGAGATATATLATNNTIVAGTITVGDNGPTPGLTGGGGNAPSNNNILNLGSGANVLSANTFIVGNIRSQGMIQWASSATTGTLLITGAAGGASTANLTVGTYTPGTAPSSASNLTLSGHNAKVQAGTVVLGVLAGATGGSGTSGRGGRIDFDTGQFDAGTLQFAVALSGAGSGPINGTFNLGSSPNSTGVLNVTNQFLMASNVGGSSTSKGTFTIKGGTANISTNIIDNSTSANASTTAIALTGGTLDMHGFAVGPIGGGTGGTRHITTITFPSLGSSAVLANLGGTGINDAGLVMNGTGALILEGNSTYTGPTNISAGTLQVGQAGDAVAPSNALAPLITNNATLAFGSSQSMTNASVITGAGGVSQTGSGTTTLTGASTYIGKTSLIAGVLSTGSIPDGGANGPLGASTNAAGNLVFSGGALQYTGGAASSDRLFTITPTGGKVDGSGSGTIAFSNTGAVVSADAASRATTDSITTNKVTVNNVSDLLVGMTVTGTNIPAGTTITAINPVASSITLSNTPTLAGADTLSFSAANRTLTLTGSTGGSIAGALSDSAGGGQLGLTKSGAGSWTLSGASNYSGVTTVQAGQLRLGAAAQGPVLAGPGGADIQGGRILFDNSGPTTVSTIAGILHDAYASNFSTGHIRSSTASGQIGLGWKEEAGSAVTVARTFYGDANLDGTVDTLDFNSLAGNFGGTNKVWSQADFNYDSVVDTLDFNNLAANFGQTVSAAAGGQSIGAVVPEPTAAGALAVLLAGSAMPRRRRRACRTLNA